MPGKFVLKRTSDDQYMFNLHAGNGEIILTSERYKQKASAQNGIESVKSNASSDDAYEMGTSKAGEPYFVMKAKNHEVIGKSEMYSSAQAAQKGIESVKSNGPSAAIDDQT